MSDIAGGQLWVSTEPRTYYVAKVHLGNAFVVPVRIEGVGRDAKVIADGELRRLTVSEILDMWLPAGIPTKIPPTWHEKLLERIDEP